MNKIIFNLCPCEIKKVQNKQPSDKQQLTELFAFCLYQLFKKFDTQKKI